MRSLLALSALLLACGDEDTLSGTWTAVEVRDGDCSSPAVVDPIPAAHARFVLTDFGDELDWSDCDATSCETRAARTFTPNDAGDPGSWGAVEGAAELWTDPDLGTQVCILTAFSWHLSEESPGVVVTRSTLTATDPTVGVAACTPTTAAARVSSLPCASKLVIKARR